MDTGEKKSVDVNFLFAIYIFIMHLIEKRALFCFLGQAEH